jgi:hypothetical protein
MNWDKLIRILCTIWIAFGIFVILGVIRSGRIVLALFAGVIILGSLAIGSRMLIGKFIMLLYCIINAAFGLILIVLGKSNLIMVGKGYLFPAVIIGVILSIFFGFVVFMWHPNQSSNQEAK